MAGPGVGTLMFACAAVATAIAAPVVEAQQPVHRHLDAAVAVGGLSGASSQVSLKLGVLGNRLRLGVGLRGVLLVGGERAYVASQDDLIVGGVRDTIIVPTPVHAALNVAFHASARLTPALEAGINLDLIGNGVGAPRTVDSRSTVAAFRGDWQAKPTRFNLFRGGSNRGTTDSEFFLGWWLRSDRAVRAGVSRVSAEYTARPPLSGGNERFRATSTRLFAAITLAR